jgi:N-acyl-D-amino-acid deacylase
VRHHDIVIRGGLIVDGTGAPGYQGDIGIAGNRIVSVGRGSLDGARTLEASGHVVSPGFIDLHSHADFTLEGCPDATTQLHQGVTTLVTGNCGWSPFPISDKDRLKDWTAFLEPELSWDWTDLKGFSAVAAALRPRVNIMYQVGHSALRLAAMGDADRTPTADELSRMAELLREAGDQGAVGFSTGLIYAPGSFSDNTEVQVLASAAAEKGLLYSTHLRNETGGLLAAVAEAIAVAEETGVRLEISHLKVMGRAHWGTVRKALDLIDEARQRGVDVTADVYPYTASSTTLSSRLPSWALDGGKTMLLERLQHHATRKRIADEVTARFDRDIDPEGVLLADLPQGRYSRFVGHSIAAIGRADGTGPAEAMLRVLEHHEVAVSITNHAMSEEDMTAVLRHPQVSVASDGMILKTSGNGRPHPRSFGTFARVLGRYVRDEGVLTLEDAIRKMTSLPASRINDKERGVLAEGTVADIAVFDAGLVIDQATYTDPWRLATGISTVLVDGRVELFESRLATRSTEPNLRKETS